MVADTDTNGGRNWVNLPAPSPEHPDEWLLWEAETTLQSIEELSERLDIKHAFARRLEEYGNEIHSATRPVLTTEHKVAFIGDIGVGKSTAICRIVGLEVQKDGTDLPDPVLEVGGGGVTICEVSLVQGPDFGLFIEPRNEDEVSKEVREFARFLIPEPRPNQDAETEDPEFHGTSKEIERAIRNMSGLVIRRPRSADGERMRVDSARELAQDCADSEALASQILTKMDLHRRTKCELQYSAESGKEPLAWLKETFEQVNNGRHPAVSLPRRIELTVPSLILGEGSLSIRIVDTKGIDGTAGRDDLERHFNEPNTVVILCSPFNNAPSPSVQQLLERTKEGGFLDLEVKTAVLVLPRPEEALAVKDDQGISADTVDEGYELKKEQAELRLRSADLPNVGIQFFNVREEDSMQISNSLLAMVQKVREKHSERLIEAVLRAKEVVENYEAEQQLEVLQEAAKHLNTWIQNNQDITIAASKLLQTTLTEAIEIAHPSSLRASVNRQGEWHNLDYPHQLAHGARVMANIAIGIKMRDFKAITTNLLQNPELEGAANLVLQARRILESGVNNVLEESQSKGRDVHSLEMKPDMPFWYRCANEWGQGPGYRDRVSEHHGDWFSDVNHRASLLDVHRFVQSEWRAILARLSAILQVG